MSRRNVLIATTLCLKMMLCVASTPARCPRWRRLRCRPLASVRRCRARMMAPPAEGAADCTSPPATRRWLASAAQQWRVSCRARVKVYGQVWYCGWVRFVGCGFGSRVSIVVKLKTAQGWRHQRRNQTQSRDAAQHRQRQVLNKKHPWPQHGNATLSYAAKASLPGCCITKLMGSSQIGRQRHNAMQEEQEFTTIFAHMERPKS